MWRFRCHTHVCAAILFSFTTHNSVFFFVLMLTISILVISTFFLSLGKVCCLFIKIICGVTIISIFSLFFFCKNQGGEQLTFLMYAGYFECLGFEPFKNFINHNCRWLSQVDCMLCNYFSTFNKDQFLFIINTSVFLQLL